MKRCRATAGLATFLILTTVTSGCAVKDPSRYYALGTSRAPAAVGAAAMTSGLTIGVGPVAIPGYLDRPQVVTRDAGDGLEIWPYHRWAEPLDMGIARTLSDDLAARIPTERVLAFPWRGSGQAIEYQVVVVGGYARRPIGCRATRQRSINTSPIRSAASDPRFSSGSICWMPCAR